MGNACSYLSYKLALFVYTMYMRRLTSKLVSTVQDFEKFTNLFEELVFTHAQEEGIRADILTKLMEDSSVFTNEPACTFILQHPCVSPNNKPYFVVLKQANKLQFYKPFHVICDSEDTYFNRSYFLRDILELGDYDMLHHFILKHKAFLEQLPRTFFDHNVALCKNPKSLHMLADMTNIKVSSLTILILWSRWRSTLSDSHITADWLEAYFRVVDKPYECVLTDYNVISTSSLDVFYKHNVRVSSRILLDFLHDGNWAIAEKLLARRDLLVSHDDNYELFASLRSFTSGLVRQKGVILWDTYPLTFALLKKLRQDTNTGSNLDMISITLIDSVIEFHDSRIAHISKQLKDVVQHTDVVDHVILDYLQC